MRPTTRSFYAQVVRGTVDHIANHLDDAQDLRRLAAMAHMSPFHFHRIFRGMVGETALELSRRLRMERAAWRLLHTDQSVTRIGFDAGYETHEGFTRAFRGFYGTSPSGFRRRSHPRIEIASASGLHYRESGISADFIPRDTGGATMDVDIVDRPAIRVAAVRHTGPYMQIGEAFARLGAIAGATGLEGDGVAEMLAIFHDDPETTPPELLRSDAGLSVSDDRSLPEGLTEVRLPAGRYARTLHVGPYEQLGDTWSRFMGEWLAGSGHRLGAGVSYEIYLNTPAGTPPEELRTELCIPLE